MMITHVTTDLRGDEGYLQKAEVSVKMTVQQNQQLYISIWAVNQVGFSWGIILSFHLASLGSHD